MTKEKYLQTIMNGLNVSKKDKQRIYEDLNSDIETALENGETWQEIYERLGSAEEVLEELKENFEEAPKKSNKKIIIGIVAAVLIVCSRFYRIAVTNSKTNLVREFYNL